MIMQTPPHHAFLRLRPVGEECVPVEQVAEREQVAQIGRWRELHAGERGLQLPIEQRVDPALGGQRRPLAGDAHPLGRGEVRTAQHMLVAVPAA